MIRGRLLIKNQTAACQKIPDTEQDFIPPRKTLSLRPIDLDDCRHRRTDVKVDR